MVMAAVALGSAAATTVVAHRGYWKTGGSAQNSIAALVKSDSIGCYGSEFDVWLSADGKIVVNHDPTFKGKKICLRGWPWIFWKMTVTYIRYSILISV